MLVCGLLQIDHQLGGAHPSIDVGIVPFYRIILAIDHVGSPFYDMIAGCGVFNIPNKKAVENSLKTDKKTGENLFFKSFPPTFPPILLRGDGAAVRPSRFIGI
jgi:hypothetical protein